MLEQNRSMEFPSSDDKDCGRDEQTACAADAFLNPFEEIAIHRHHLPHWQQAHVWQFVTWRLADALPRQTLEEWNDEKDRWLQLHPPPWEESTKLEHQDRFTRRTEQWLDAGHGACLLRLPAAAVIVARALRHFEGSRYELGAFVIMPNHVHVLFQPKPLHSVSRIVSSWKSFTAKEINRLLGRNGTLWQEDYWDRMIRDEEHWEACRQYILENPKDLPRVNFVLECGRPWNGERD